MALRSKFKFNEKLRNCEIKDADHIGQFTFPVADRQGEHVRLIHEALNAFLNGKERFDTITGPEFDTRTFGARTAQVVREFKTQRWGNHTGTIRSSRWTSSMDLGEIHGTIFGFEPVDRSVAVKQSVRDNDDLSHDEVIGVTNAEVQRNIQDILALAAARRALLRSSC
jgi:hypothetical protein